MQPGREGGTWLGLSAKDSTIKVGALLNVPRSTSIESAARGVIVTNYLIGKSNSIDYSKTLINCHAQYNAFNHVSIEFK